MASCWSIADKGWTWEEYKQSPMRFTIMRRQYVSRDRREVPKTAPVFDQMHRAKFKPLLTDLFYAVLNLRYADRSSRAEGA